MAATQIKPGYAETGNGYTQNEAGERETGREGPGPGPGPGRGFLAVELVLRVLVIAATMAAAIVMATAKQTEIVPVQIIANAPPLFLPVPAKYQYSPAFVYFVVANAVACGYTGLSIIMSLHKLKSSASSISSALHLSITDLIMVALVSSAASAATAVGYIGLKGNSHTNWNKICHVYDKFCDHVGAAVAVSFVGMANLIILTLMSLYTLYKHARLHR